MDLQDVAEMRNIIKYLSVSEQSFPVSLIISAPDISSIIPRVMLAVIFNNMTIILPFRQSITISLHSSVQCLGLVMRNTPVRRLKIFHLLARLAVSEMFMV